MKKLLVFALTLCCMGAIAQDAVITFTETKHDFGKINEADGRVTHVFEFKNEGMAPLTLTNVRASCGCTTPDWTKSPVEPGATGVINVTYNPSGRPGKFNKTITVTSNAKEPTVRLYISGEVIPKTAKAADKYSIKMGNLALSQKSLNFGDIKKSADGTTAPKTLDIDYANGGDKDMTVALKLVGTDEFILPHVTLPVAKPNEVGQFIINVSAERTNVWGPIDADLLVIIDGKEDKANRINVKANIVEDFSNLTESQRKNAPICEIAEEINLGSIQAGKTLKSTNLKLKNSGNNPLQIRRILNSDKSLQVSTKASTVKGGKTTNLIVNLATEGMDAGRYSRQITFITNDPDNSVKRVNVVWTVE